MTSVLLGPLALKLLEVTPIVDASRWCIIHVVPWSGVLAAGPICISAPQSVSRYAIVCVHVCVDSTGFVTNAGSAPAGWRSHDQDGGSQIRGPGGDQKGGRVCKASWNVHLGGNDVVFQMLVLQKSMLPSSGESLL